MYIENVVVLLVIGLTLISAQTRQHDDLIIAVGDQLELLTNGTAHQQLTLNSHNASKLSALTYDPASKKLFFADKNHHRGHIFSVYLGSGSDRIVEEVVEKSSNETVDGLAYDPVDQMLLWTDGLNRSIRRLRVDHDHVHVRENSTIELIHFLEKDDKPRGLVPDPCNRILYWTNRYMHRPTIERSYLNGTQRRILIQSNLLLPNALDLDVLDQRLYWVDNLRSGYFHIERSFVNGTARQLIYRGIGQFVVSLAVGRDYVYWSDYDQKKVWCIHKDGSSDTPTVLRAYPNNVPTGLTVLNRQPINCSLVPSLIFNPDDQQVVKPVIDDVGHFDEDEDLCEGFCYNDGLCSGAHSGLKCSCQLGFSGERCEKVVEKQAKACTTVVAEVSRTKLIALIGLSLGCVILMIYVIFLSLKLKNHKKLKRVKRRHLPRAEMTNSVPDLENCCNSITLCERPCPQQQPLNKTTTPRGNCWIEENDGADLLKNDFLNH